MLTAFGSIKDYIYPSFSAAAERKIPTSTKMLLITRMFWGLFASGEDTTPAVGTTSPLAKPVPKLTEDVEEVEEVVDVVEVVEEEVKIGVLEVVGDGV